MPYLDKIRQLRRVDELPVWSISCFYTCIGYRKRGVTTALMQSSSPEPPRSDSRVTSLPAPF